MGYAVIQTVEAYHPEGREDRPKTTEFIHWIFEEKKEANAHKKDLLIAHVGSDITVKKVEEEAWTPANLVTAQKEKK